MDRTLEQTARLGELKLQNHDPKITAKKKKHNKDNAEQQQHSFKRNLGQTDFGDHWEQKKKENKLEETTQLGDSTKRNPPQKDPEISAEKKNKDGDRDSIYDDNAEQQQQQQQQHSLLRKLGETELRDHSEQQQQKKKKNESSEEEEVSDYLYQSSEEEFSDSLIYKSSEEEEENMSDASEYDELDYESCEAFGHLVKEITAEQEKLDNKKRLACEAKGETYISDVKRRRLAYENSAEAEERYGQMVCASESTGFSRV